MSHNKYTFSFEMCFNMHSSNFQSKTITKHSLVHCRLCIIVKTIWYNLNAILGIYSVKSYSKTKNSHRITSFIRRIPFVIHLLQSECWLLTQWEKQTYVLSFLICEIVFDCWNHGTFNGIFTQIIIHTSRIEKLNCNFVRRQSLKTLLHLLCVIITPIVVILISFKNFVVRNSIYYWNTWLYQQKLMFNARCTPDGWWSIMWVK